MPSCTPSSPSAASLTTPALLQTSSRRFQHRRQFMQTTIRDEGNHHWSRSASRWSQVCCSLLPVKIRGSRNRELHLQGGSWRKMTHEPSKRETFCLNRYWNRTRCWRGMMKQCGTMCHYVSPPEFLSDEAERTVIVLGWPGSNSLEASVYKSGNSKSPIDAQPVGHS